MDSILFSVNPKLACISDVVSHLKTHREVYFEVRFPIVRKNFSFPINGFMHISGDRVRYVGKIGRIIDFSKDHYEDPKLAEAVKPEAWRKDWRENRNGICSLSWESVLVICQVAEFECDTCTLNKSAGGLVSQAPQKYIRVISPPGWIGF